MSLALGCTCWAWASEAWALSRVSLDAGEDDESLLMALLSIVEAIVERERSGDVVVMEMG